MPKLYFSNKSIIQPPCFFYQDQAQVENVILPDGCYRVSWLEGELLRYEGTVRVSRNAACGVAISGDLYEVTDGIPTAQVVGQIPFFKRKLYRYYLQTLRIAGCDPLCAKVDWEFQRIPYKAGSQHGSAADWEEPETYSVTLVRDEERLYTAPVPKKVTSSAAELVLQWISPWMRAATLEIDRGSNAPPPLTNGNGIDWATIWRDVGWDLKKIVIDSVQPNQSQCDSWDDAALHKAMLLWRDERVDLDCEWRYHLLCVQGLERKCLGLMYDVGAGDSNNIPREGAAIATDSKFSDGSQWSAVNERSLSSVPQAYFRTAVHEIGHVMGLFHDTDGSQFMRETVYIGEDGYKTGNLFPANIKWSFKDADAIFLQHAPDPLVRPGGAKPAYSLDNGYSNPKPANHLHLAVSPVEDAIPLGAPVRAELLLKRRVSSGDEVLVPDNIGLSGLHVRGEVFGPYPDDKSRSFRPLLVPGDGGNLQRLLPNSSVEGALTLLRGGEGELFPEPGKYEIEVELRWHDGKTPWIVVGKASVTIEPPRSKADESAAKSVLGARDLLLTLVIGGDHLHEGIAAIQTAMKNRTLRRHYAGIEAKRRAALPNSGLRQLTAAALLIDARTVLSRQEREKVKRVLGDHLRGLRKWRLERCLREHKPASVMGQAMDRMFDALLRFLIVAWQWMKAARAVRS